MLTHTTRPAWLGATIAVAVIVFAEAIGGTVDVALMLSAALALLVGALLGRSGQASHLPLTETGAPRRHAIAEALLAIDSREATAAVVESYGRALAALREARKGADPSSAAKIDAQIAALERERAGLRRPDPLLAAVAANAGRVERRRTEIESAGQ